MWPPLVLFSQIPLEEWISGLIKKINQPTPRMDKERLKMVEERRTKLNRNLISAKISIYYYFYWWISPNSCLFVLYVYLIHSVS